MDGQFGGDLDSDINPAGRARTAQGALDSQVASTARAGKNRTGHLAAAGAHNASAGVGDATGLTGSAASQTSGAAASHPASAQPAAVPASNPEPPASHMASPQRLDAAANGAAAGRAQRTDDRRMQADVAGSYETSASASR